MIPTALAEEINTMLLSNASLGKYITQKGIEVTENFGLGSLKYGYPERRIWFIWIIL